MGHYLYSPRVNAIREEFMQGNVDNLSALARRYGISRQRIHQLLIAWLHEKSPGKERQFRALASSYGYFRRNRERMSCEALAAWLEEFRALVDALR